MCNVFALKKEKLFVDAIKVHRVAIDDTHMAIREVAWIEVREGEAKGFYEDIHHCIVGWWGKLFLLCPKLILTKKVGGWWIVVTSNLCFIKYTHVTLCK